MEQISKKNKLTKKEIIAAGQYFKIGKIISHTLIKEGVINSNYILNTNSGKYILRVYKFKRGKEIKSELALLRYLSDKKFPCPVPVKDIYKTSQKKISCFKYIEGKTLRKIGARDLKKISSLVARLHNLTKNYKLKYKREGEGLSVIKRYFKNNKQIILNSKFKEKEKFINFLESELKKLRLNPNLPSGAVHVDVKMENIIINKKGQISLIDFDNFYLDTFITDIANTIMWLCLNEKEELDIKKTKIFLKQYDKIRKISKKEKGNLYENLKFYCLKQAFKYAFICLPKLKFAEHWSYLGIKRYNNLIKMKREIYEI